MATESVRSSAPMSSTDRAYVFAVCSGLPWRCITPFGRPVVPDEYSQNPLLSRAVGATSASDVSVNSVEGWMSTPAIVSAASPITTTCSIDGATPTIGAACATSGPETTIALAPASAAIAPRSALRSIVDSGTGTTPERIAPRNQAGNAGSSRTTMTTRSPSPIPSAASACWTRQISASNASYVSDSPRHRNATRSPPPAPTCRSTSHSAAL